MGDSEDDLVNNIEAMLRHLVPLSTDCSIYEVPVALRSVDVQAYTPSMVSIGPMHHGKAEYQGMEAHKRHYLKDFLGRNPKVGVSDYVGALRDLENAALSCYAPAITLNSDDFVKMMLLDAIFLIELFLKWKYRDSHTVDDLIFNDSRMRVWLRPDLLLLENQLPFFVIGKLYDTSQTHDQSLYYLTIDYFELKRRDSSIPPVKHFVDLLLQDYLPPKKSSTTNKSLAANEDLKPIPSATELKNKGISFKQGSRGKFPMDLEFTNEVLEIPLVVVSDATNSRFRNLIAMEQSSKTDNTYFTDYVMLLDCLIQTPDDVALLRECRVIKNALGDDEAVSKLFNKLCDGVIISASNNYYKDVIDAIHGSI